MAAMRGPRGPLRRSKGAWRKPAPSLYARRSFPSLRLTLAGPFYLRLSSRELPSCFSMAGVLHKAWEVFGW